MSCLITKLSFSFYKAFINWIRTRFETVFKLQVFLSNFLDLSTLSNLIFLSILPSSLIRGHWQMKKTMHLMVSRCKIPNIINHYFAKDRNLKCWWLILSFMIRKIYYLTIMHIHWRACGGTRTYLSHLSSVTSFPLARLVKPVRYV